MKRVATLLLALMLLPALAMGATFQLKPDLKVTLPDLTAPWVASTEPPAELIEHLTEHVLEEAAARAKPRPRNKPVRWR